MHFISGAFVEVAEPKQGQHNALIYYDLLCVYDEFIVNYK